MFDQNKKYKIFGAAAVLVLVIAFILCNVKISSVKNHDNEKNIAADSVSTDMSSSDLASVNNNTISTSSRDESAEGENKDSSAEHSEVNSKTEDNKTEDSDTGTEQHKGAEESNDSVIKDQQTSDTNLEQRTENNKGSTENNTNNNTQDNTKAQDNTEETRTEQQEQEQSSKGESTSQEKDSNTVTCTIEIRCDEAVQKKNDISNEGIKECIPDDGIILGTIQYTVEAGMNVYELLSRAAASNGIPIVANSSKTYISSINNLSEKMVTAASGWTYYVNGILPNTPAIRYVIADGDTIQWRYVCSYR